mgnify:CR=1 FL=1
MHCPFCGFHDTVVKDSRPAEDGASIRRRRECPSCHGRFTTYERVQNRELKVIKRDGTRELLDRDKLHKSLSIALRKRAVSDDRIDAMISDIVSRVEKSGETEIRSNQLGEIVMQVLAITDPVGYIRYSSVYRDFSKAEDFTHFVQHELGQLTGKLKGRKDS